MTKKEELIKYILKLGGTQPVKELNKMSEDDLIFVKLRLSMNNPAIARGKFNKGHTLRVRRKNTRGGWNKKKP